VKLLNQATGKTVTAKPFLDGSLTVRNLEPGPYQMTVLHPNLINPILTKKIRVFPQPTPTRIPIPIPADLFRDTPIQDIPDADLGPVQAVAASVGSSVAPIAGKAPGEVIRSSDWNVLAQAITDLAGAVGELTRIVAPLGHNHPEIEVKINEVQGNIQRFSEAFGRSLLELRREIESENLRKRLGTVLDEGGASTELRDRVFTRIKDLELITQDPTPVWSKAIAGHGTAMIREIQELAEEQESPAEFLQATSVVQTFALLENFAAAGGKTKPEDELLTYSRGTAKVGPSVFGALR
jgi:hypothetical protein